MAKQQEIKITQVKSSIGYHQKQKQTLVALGLKKINQSVVQKSTPQILGMIKKVQHLVAVEDVK